MSTSKVQVLSNREYTLLPL